MRPVIEGKGVLDIEFDRVKQHMSCLQFFSDRRGGPI